MSQGRNMSVSKKRLIANRENARKSTGPKPKEGRQIADLSIPDERHVFNILRYEMRLDRQLTRTYQLLRRLQERRSAGSEGYSSEKQKNSTTKPFAYILPPDGHLP